MLTSLLLLGQNTSFGKLLFLAHEPVHRHLFGIFLKDGKVHHRTCGPLFQEVGLTTPSVSPLSEEETQMGISYANLHFVHPPSEEQQVASAPSTLAVIPSSPYYLRTVQTHSVDTSELIEHPTQKKKRKMHSQTDRRDAKTRAVHPHPNENAPFITNQSPTAPSSASGDSLIDAQLSQDHNQFTLSLHRPDGGTNAFNVQINIGENFLGTHMPSSHTKNQARP
jgi:hypothetical protein